MNKEILKNEILIQCQNVQCGAKLAAEVHYVYKETRYAPEDVLFIDFLLKQWPDLKYVIVYHPDKQAAKEGWKSMYIYKYDKVDFLINQINNIKDKNSILYHFCNGKLFGYNDFEVMKFIKKEG